MYSPKFDSICAVFVPDFSLKKWAPRLADITPPARGLRRCVLRVRFLAPPGGPTAGDALTLGVVTFGKLSLKPNSPYVSNMNCFFCSVIVVVKQGRYKRKGKF